MSRDTTRGYMKKFEIAVMASSLVNPLAIKRRIQSELSASGIDRLGFAVALLDAALDGQRVEQRRSHDSDLSCNRARGIT